MVVGEHNVPDRLVGNFTDAANHVLRHDRGGLGVDHHDAVVADDHASVRITLGGIGIEPLGQFGEADSLGLQIALGREFLAHLPALLVRPSVREKIAIATLLKAAKTPRPSM